MLVDYIFLFNELDELVYLFFYVLFTTNSFEFVDFTKLTFILFYVKL